MSEFTAMLYGEILVEIAEHEAAISHARTRIRELTRELQRRVLLDAKYGDWIPDDGYASGHAYAKPSEQREDRFRALCGREARIGVSGRLYKCGRCKSILESKVDTPAPTTSNGEGL